MAGTVATTSFALVRPAAGFRVPAGPDNVRRRALRSAPPGARDRARHQPRSPARGVAGYWQERTLAHSRGTLRRYYFVIFWGITWLLILTYCRMGWLQYGTGRWLTPWASNDMNLLPKTRILYRVAMVIACAVIVAWLAFGKNPTEARLDRINGLIASGKIGKVEPALQERLEQQFRWLAHHAGVRDKVAVNGTIRPHQLTLIVTEPEYASLTHCGPGNAIYDPSLQTIFVDHALVWPTEIMAIGTESVNTMFTVNKVGYIVSYTNFLLAHELGHWQKHDRSSAFFHYGWNEGDGPAGF